VGAFAPTAPGEARARALVRRALGRPDAPSPGPSRVLVVDVELQKLALLDGERLVAEYPVSTAAAGVGGLAGTMRTPPGWHRVHRKIGAGALRGAVFASREPTGAVWSGEPGAADLILTRILTLEGLEPGVNQGGERDSLARYIYLHGTNHEDRLGTPASHGCVRLANADVIDLFERVAEGDPVLVAGLEEVPDPVAAGRFHYAGLGGSGMSALAQFQAMLGGRASGSDRAFDRGERGAARAQLERLGIAVFPQDGSGVGDDCAALVVSTAVEEQVADVAAARERGVPLVHRSELLAHFVSRLRTVAVSGTSGKSTTVAMAFEILRGAGRDPSVITGGELVVLQRAGLWGNAWRGGSDLLVVEADESDGSLTRYAPAVGVVLNLRRDHREESEVAAMFAAFRERTRERLVVGEADNLRGLRAGATVFGFGPEAELRGEDVRLEPDGASFSVGGVRFRLPVPGRHNVENALGAIAAGAALDVPLAEMVGPLARFAGVARRFQSLGAAAGVEVVDDFAHNPDKVRAALATAQARSARVLAVYQPHGYGPTRFLRAGFVAAFAEALRPMDRLWWLEVFYAGGTATRDFSAAEIVAEIAARGAAAEFAPSRPWLVERLGAEARAGDLILVMGARDPSLTDLAQAILARLGGADRPTGSSGTSPA
jgi:UDP-N-acetylmuramate-alanine ligase